ncbi:MAG: HNH endonuclease, partial [Agrococcus casei]
MPKWLFITLLIALPILFGAIHPILFFLALAGVLIANPLIWKYRKNKYFNGEEFQGLRAQIASVVAEHNEVVNYVAEIRGQGAFELGASSTGQYAHLANFENTSNWNYQRDR